MVDSPIRDEIARLSLKGYKFDMPPEFLTTEMGAVPLSPHQYERFVQLSAGIDSKFSKKTLEQELNHQIKAGFPAYSVDKKYKVLDDNRYNMIRDIIQSYRKAATNQLSFMEDIGKDLPAKYTELGRVKFKAVTGKEISVPIRPPGGGIVK